MRWGRTDPADAALVVATLGVIAALVVLVVGALPGWFESWQEDLGYTDGELNRVERICEDQLDGITNSDRYDALYERCEEREKDRINPDPFS